MAACHLRQFPAVLLAVVLVALVSSTFSEKSPEPFPTEPVPTEPVPTEPNEEASNSTNESPSQFTLSAISSSSSRSSSSSLSSVHHQSSLTNAGPSPTTSHIPITAGSIYKTAPTSTVSSLHMSVSSVANRPSVNSIFPSETQSSVATSSQAIVALAMSSATSTAVLETVHISTSSSFVQRTKSSSSLYTDTVSSASQSSSIMLNTTKTSTFLMQISSSASQTKSVSSIAQSSTVLTNMTGHVQDMVTSFSSASQTKSVSSMAPSSTILPNATSVVQDIMTTTIYPSTSVCIDCTSSTSAAEVRNSTAFGMSPSPATLATMTLSSNSSIAMEKPANTSYFLMPSTAVINMTRTTVNRTAVSSSLNQSTAFVVQTSTASPSSVGLFSSIYNKQLNITASSPAMPRTSSVTPTTPPVLAPSASPRDVQVYNTSSTSIKITWRPPPSGTLHGVLTKYEVLVQKRIRSTASPSASYSSDRTPVSSISANGINPSPTSIVLTEPTESPTEQSLSPESLVSPINAGLNLSIVVRNLEKFTLYEVRVRAVTVLAGPFSASVAVRTDEDVPSACRTISLSDQNSTSVMVHWTGPLQINGILLGYKVYYDSGFRFSTQVVASNKMAYLLKGLVPFTRYIINVTAFTKKGEGRQISTSFNTLQAAPSAIRNLSGLAINSTAARISWKRPEYLNGEIEYIVMMRSSGGEEAVLPVQIYQGSETQNVATGLQPVTRYIFSVYARNVRYLWQSTVVDVTVVTLASEPSGPPLVIQAIVKNSTSIQVEWQPPSPSLRNGFIKTYVVQYSSDKAFYISQATQDNSTSVLLTSLSPYTLYYIKVQAVNLAGAGPFSELVANRTSEDAPSPPTNFTARSVNATCILVTWKKPRHLNGETVGYKLCFRLTSADSSQDRLAYSGESMMYLVSSLQEHANYTFTLYAYNVKYGYESASVLAMETTHPAAPSGPPQNTRAVTLSSRSILVQWDPPKTLDMNGIITAYVVTMRRPDGTHENHTSNGNTNRLIFVSLRPYTVYIFTVQAMNKIGAGPRSPPVSNRTYEEVPGAPILDQVTNLTSTVLQISWLPPADPNGKLTAFNVCWQLLDQSNQVCKETDGTTRTFNIVRLNPYSLYNVTVAAATSKGYGPSVSGVYRTMEGVPSKPQNLQGWNVSSFSIFVTWTAPSNSNGILTSYNVTYRPKQDSSTPDSVDSALSTNVTLTNLKVFTLYEICVQGSTSQGFGDQACKSISTDEGVPGSVSSLVGAAVTPYSIHLSWKAPSFPNGNIGYILCYYLAISHECDSRKRFPGSQVEYYVRGLNPYTNYNFSIKAYNLKKSLKGPARVITVRTKTALPSGPPLNVRLVKATTESLSITWDPPAKPNGPIKDYRLIINNVKTSSDRDYKVASDTQYTFESLDPGQEYGIRIGAIAAGVLGTGPLSKEYIFSTVPSSPPPLPPVNPPDKDKITANEITIELHKAKDSNGKVRFYQVIVLEVAPNDEGHPKPPDKKPKEYEPSELVTYQQARKRRPELVPYIAAEFAAEDFERYQMFQIGDAKNYSISARKRRDTETRYYNGPLDPGTYYTAFQRAAVSRTIFTSSSWIDPVSTTASSVSAKKKITSSTNTGLVVGLCVTFILIIIFIVVVFAFLWKKRRFDFGVMLDDESEYTGSRSLRLKKMRGGRRRTSNRGLMGSTDSLDNIDDARRRRQPIPIEDFSNLVRRMHTDGDIGFSEEYELVQPNDEDFTWHHSLHSANKYKNRYANIVSYDHSRVLLTPIEGVAGSDYINANYIDGYSRSSAYIACQGPLPDTFEDFWRMIWEQGTATIVMLTQLEERGRRKCDQYWPDRGTRNYGMIRVTASETSHMSYYILRTFILSHKQEEEEPRQIKQYHFTSWPDHGVPTHPAPLLSLVRNVANANPATAGPMVVHCSAGVGRTGTYITLDAMLQKIEKEQVIDVFEFVKQMRTKRNIMVQTEAQYVFIYDALNEAVSCGVTEFEAKKFSARLRELREVDPDTGRSYMEKEFLRLVRDERHPSTFKNANLGVNSSKNRYANILPYEKTRVPLKMRPGEVGSDYINASYIDGYCRLKVFIATQAPVPNTFEDFWRMIWEQKSSAIVMLTREEEAGKVKCHRYWPSDGTRIFGNVLVELSEEVSYADYVMRQFNLTHTEDKEVRTVRQYQYIDWPDVGLPESGVGIIDLIGQVEKWQQQSSNSIITVHCSGGVGRTGVFCAVSVLIERVKAEGVIDVFQTVQSLRLLRPAMVQTIEQYEFCYSTLQEYLDSFDLYSNFQ